MSKHTPGPWKVITGIHQETTELHKKEEEWFTVESEDDTVAECLHGRCNAIDSEEALANARLIAAAPEMLQWLEYFAQGPENDVFTSKKIKELLNRINP